MTASPAVTAARRSSAREVQRPSRDGSALLQFSSECVVGRPGRSLSCSHSDCTEGFCSSRRGTPGCPSTPDPPTKRELSLAPNVDHALAVDTRGRLTADRLADKIRSPAGALAALHTAAETTPLPSKVTRRSASAKCRQRDRNRIVGVHVGGQRTAMGTAAPVDEPARRDHQQRPVREPNCLVPGAEPRVATP